MTTDPDALAVRLTATCAAVAFSAFVATWLLRKAGW